MKHLILSIFTFISIGINAQNYNDSNVHYYMPVGYSPEDIGKVYAPVTPIIERGSSIYSFYLSGIWSSEAKHDRDRCIRGINKNIRTSSISLGSYNSKVSTSKYDVYSESYPSDMFGSGFTRYHAISKDHKELIRWDDRDGADKRKRYYEVDINDILPKSVESYDFLE